MLSILLWLTIVINEVVPAPSSGPEYVELYNPSNTTVDVSGWRIDDDTPGGTTTTIAAGTSIAPYQVLAIPLTSAILNNTGDAVVLLDALGNQVDRIDFGALKAGESMARIPDGSTTIIKVSASIGQLNVSASVTPTPSSTSTAIMATMQYATETVEATVTVSTPTQPVDTPTLVPPTQTESPQPATNIAITVLLSASPTVTASSTSTTPSRTASTTRTPSSTKTPSMTRTASLTRTPSMSKTPSLTTTASPSKTPSLTTTASPSKTPSTTPTPQRTPITPPQTPRDAVTIPSQVTLALLLDATRRPMLDVCVPAPATLGGWSINEEPPFAPDTPRCQRIPVDAHQLHVHLYNPNDVHMATLDIHAAWCQLDLSVCKPTPSPIPANTPQLAAWRPPSVVRTTPPHTPVRPRPVIPAPPAPAPWPWQGIMGGVCVSMGLWMWYRVAQQRRSVLYCGAGDDAEISINGVSSESGSV